MINNVHCSLHAGRDVNGGFRNGHGSRTRSYKRVHEHRRGKTIMHPRGRQAAKARSMYRYYKRAAGGWDVRTQLRNCVWSGTWPARTTPAPVRSPLGTGGRDEDRVRPRRHDPSSWCGTPQILWLLAAGRARTRRDLATTWAAEWAQPQTHKIMHTTHSVCYESELNMYMCVMGSYVTFIACRRHDAIR